MIAVAAKDRCPFIHEIVFAGVPLVRVEGAASRSRIIRQQWIARSQIGQREIVHDVQRAGIQARRWNNISSEGRSADTRDRISGRGIEDLIGGIGGEIFAEISGASESRRHGGLNGAAKTLPY